MADFHTNGDDFSKKRFKKNKENLVKADVMLVKQNVMLPTILPAPEDILRFFHRSCDPKETYNVRRKISRTSKESEICKSTNKLDKKLKSLSFEKTLPKCKNPIEERRSAPPGFPRYTCLKNFLSQSTLHNHQELKLSSPNLVSSTKSNSFSNEEKSEYNFSQKSLPLKKKDLCPQVKVENSCDSIQNKLPIKVEDKVKSYYLKNDQKSLNHEDIAEDKLENWKSKFCESERATNKLVNIFSNEKNNKSEGKKIDCQIKYSWQDIENWIPPIQKEEITKSERRKLDCKVTYSWQVVGISTQTSLEFLQNFDKNSENERHQCKIKYSWQILGKGTQVSLNEYENHLSLKGDYWKGSILLPRENYNKWNKIKSSVEIFNPRKKAIILYSEGTQTFTDKRTQTELTDCRVKYSWENLIHRHLKSHEFSKFDGAEKISYDKYCVDHLKTRLEPIKCSTKYSWQNLIKERLK